MSCDCHTTPCSCVAPCDPANEPLSSALNNFIAAFFGSVQKTCVNGRVQWVLPCDLDAGIPGFPRIGGEGVSCYLIRYVQSVIAQPIPVFHYFPSAQAIFLDKNFELLNNHGQEAYGTFQEAYNAANAVATSSNPVTIMVGVGNSVEFGNVDLTADWNPNVGITGVNRATSNVGFINGQNATGAGRSVVLTANNVTIQGIFSYSGLAGGAGGNIKITGNSRATVLAFNTSGGVGGAGGQLLISGITANNVIMANGGGTAGQLLAKLCQFEPHLENNCVDNCSSISAFVECLFATASDIGSNLDCVADLSGNGVQFINCVFYPVNAGFCIDASVPRTIVSYNSLGHNGNSANVTLSEGTFANPAATLIYPQS